jgi:hypothetical protein
MKYKMSVGVCYVPEGQLTETMTVICSWSSCD